MPERLGEKACSMLRQTVRFTGRYFKALLISSCAVGVLYFIVLKHLGVVPAGLLGSLAGILNIIPVVGPWIAAVLCGVIELFIDPLHALYAVLAMLGVQLVDQCLLSPLIIGKSVGFKPLAVLCVTAAASSLLGFWGLLLAVPIAGAIRIAYRVFASKPTGAEGTHTVD